MFNQRCTSHDFIKQNGLAPNDTTNNLQNLLYMNLKTLFLELVTL